jgi:hypothetical protein
MRTLLGLSLVPLFAILAACGGGGSGSPANTILPSPPSTNGVALHAGVSGGGTSLMSDKRWVHANAARRPLDVNLNALPEQGEFEIPDSYINVPPGTTGAATVVAWLSTTDGTMQGIPFPLPVPTFVETGVSATVSNVSPAPTPHASVPPINIGSELLNPPTQTGVTTINVAASVGSQTLTAQSVFYTYPMFCIASPSNNQPDFGCVQALSWDAQGQEHVAPSNASSDFYMSQNPDGTTNFVFPSGAIELSSTLLYSVVNVPTIGSTTTFPSVDAFNDGHLTFVFRTAAGPIVKCEPDGLVAGNAAGGLNNGNIGDASGPYQATTTSTFAY